MGTTATVYASTVLCHVQRPLPAGQNRQEHQFVLCLPWVQLLLGLQVDHVDPAVPFLLEDHALQEDQVGLSFLWGQSSRALQAFQQPPSGLAHLGTL